jgi:hypothetical protein
VVGQHPRGVAGEHGLGVDRRTEAEADEVILGLAGGKEAAEVLEVGLGEGGERGGGGGMGDAVEAVGVNEEPGAGGGGA